MGVALALAVDLLAQTPVPDPSTPLIPLPASSDTAQIITVVCGGIASILVAISTVLGVRKRRDSPEPGPREDDPESLPSRLRERLTHVEADMEGVLAAKLRDRVTTLESEVGRLRHDVEALEELVLLLRAAAVVTENKPTRARPTRRRTPPRPQE